MNTPQWVRVLILGTSLCFSSSAFAKTQHCEHHDCVVAKPHAIFQNVVEISQEELAGLRLKNFRSARAAIGTLDLSSLLGDGDLPSPGAELRIALFDGTDLRMSVSRVEVARDGTVSWVAHGRDVFEELVFTKTRESVLAHLDFGQRRYSLRSVGTDSAVLELLDSRNWSLGDDTPPVALTSGYVPFPKRLASPLKSSTSSMLDIAVLWTSSAATGSDEIATVHNAVTDLNQSFINTAIDASAQIVYYGLSGYTEPTNMDSNEMFVVQQLMQQGSSPFTGLATTRDTHAADFVVLFVDSDKLHPTLAACGAANTIANNDPWYVQEQNVHAVVADGCSGVDRTVTHELGHTFGVRHDNMGSSFVVHAKAFGHAVASPDFRTIMGSTGSCSYLGGCPRINFWSNSEETYLGEDMGDVDSEATIWLRGTMMAQGAAYRTPSGSATGSIASVNVTPLYCYDMNRVSFDAASGTAGWYEVEISPNSSFAGAFQIYRGNRQLVPFEVSSTHYARVRGCNSVGCGGWTSGDEPATYTFGC